MSLSKELMSLSKEFITEYTGFSKNAKDKMWSSLPKILKQKLENFEDLRKTLSVFTFSGVWWSPISAASLSYFFSADQSLCFFTEGGRWQLPNSFVTSFSLWGGKSIWSEQVPNCQRVSGTRAEAASKSFIYKPGAAVSIVGLLECQMEASYLILRFWN